MARGTSVANRARMDRTVLRMLIYLVTAASLGSVSYGLAMRVASPIRRALLA